MTEDEMVGWHHELNGYESEQTPGDGEGQDREAWIAAVRGVTKSHTVLEIVVVVQLLSCVRLFATHGLQHARLSCPSLSPGVCSDSYPVSR